MVFRVFQAHVGCPRIPSRGINHEVPRSLLVPDVPCKMIAQKKDLGKVLIHSHAMIVATSEEVKSRKKLVKIINNIKDFSANL